MGLHLEAEPATNDRIANGLARQLLMIKARLGQQLDLEPWDRGWVRLYETHAIEVFGLLGGGLRDGTWRRKPIR